ncbi:hypothetical protein Dsin_025254 [Dipteronia sinensis]|uniref:NADP-dependent oxidoreductase domain-containing protein n=1 Tax=Dipteronia sinensis TaxID=43782 RepID=A0AAD9ZVS1_9ROSI|nr:hypothetical protein Dsin_025254 [Dipteronia sinensis]
MILFSCHLLSGVLLAASDIRICSAVEDDDGTMTFGEQNSLSQSFRLLDQAFDAGINFFDSAEMSFTFYRILFNYIL